ncbi:hypothetical protein QBC42DRAFT_256392 [Cladorrhinum samala]|uniref:Uncharacterized protein n=1 Tax=Cladorrhinum samala TaxID=585594 RepID=A0AAV9HBD9_9PEZI|nr:hypothetical protein QBC42DRAFT_256392 [Cladorrhinum samala]
MSLDLGVEIELLLAPRPNARHNFLTILVKMGWDKTITIEGQLRAGSTSNYIVDNLRNRNRRSVTEALADGNKPASADCSSGYNAWSVIDEEEALLRRAFRLLNFIVSGYDGYLNWRDFDLGLETFRSDELGAEESRLMDPNP